MIILKLYSIIGLIVFFGSIMYFKAKKKNPNVFNLFILMVISALWPVIILLLAEDKYYGYKIEKDIKHYRSRRMM